MAAAVSFFDKLTARCNAVNSLLCVGLDPHQAELEEDSADGAFAFCAKLIEETKHVAAAYKPNAAFFEVYGSAGWTTLERVCKLIPEDIPIVMDSKRGDIGSTSAAYATSAFQSLGAGSVTVSPYLGSDGVSPFLQDPARAAWVLCKTSNPGSNDLQTLMVPKDEGGQEPLYVRVAKLCWNNWAQAHKNVGLVVGATDTDALRTVRAAVPDIWFLSPGIGAQGGDLDASLEAGLRADGLGILLPISRGISRAESPKTAAEAFHAQINAKRAAITK